jgi:hypothetical protein
MLAFSTPYQIHTIIVVQLPYQSSGQPHTWLKSNQFAITTFIIYDFQAN